jgi:hypothetical protein
MMQILRIFSMTGVFVVAALTLTQPVLAAEHTLTFNGYVDGVNPLLGSEVKVGDAITAHLTYRDDQINISDNGTYRYYQNSFVRGSLRFGGFYIGLPDANGAEIYSQNSEPGFGPDRFIIQFSGLPVQPINGHNFYGLAFIFDDGNALAFDSNVLPIGNSDLSGFVRAGAILDFGDVGMYRIGGVLREFSFAPVPEPTTWALMLLGFGIAGTQIRVRRHKSRNSGNQSTVTHAITPILTRPDPAPLV